MASSVVQDILKDAMEQNLKSPTQLPYFEGDFWPNVLEESIKELEQEEEEKRKREAEEAAEAAAAAAQSTENGDTQDGEASGDVSDNSLCSFTLEGTQFLKTLRLVNLYYTMSFVNTVVTVLSR